MAQQIPLPLTQIGFTYLPGFTFLVPAYMGSPGPYPEDS